MGSACAAGDASLVIRWLIALLIGVVVAWLAYGRAGPNTNARTALLAALRGLAVAIIAALLLGAPAGLARQARALVAFDASASWFRAATDSGVVRDALRAAVKEAGADSVMLAGDSLRLMTSGNALQAAVSDGQSSLRPAIDRAAALSRPLILLTDGEIDDPGIQSDLPAGSRVIVPARTANKDAAVSVLESPFTVNAGDTLQVAIIVVAGGAGAGKGDIKLVLDGQALATVAVPSLSAFQSRRSVIPLPLSRGAKKAVLQAVVRSDGDNEARNDTLGMALDIGDKPAAVFVSTAPDLDVREALSVLRGALDVPARAYLRIAPGVWREEGSLKAVTEADVLARVQAAGLVIVHGDTAWGGVSKRSQGAHALWMPASPTAAARAGENAKLAEWYVTGAPPSPLTGALAGLPWDTLPPITAAAPAKGAFNILEARLGKTGAPVAVVAGRETAGFRTLVISGSGFAGWSMRGGRSQAAFVALWGAMFDWLAAARGDGGIARPVSAVVRSGERVRWRRGGADSMVTAVVSRRMASGSVPVDTVRLRFATADVETVSPPLPVGVYDVRVAGAAAATAATVLVVNASRELVPRAPTLITSAATRGLPAGSGPRVSDYGWMFGLALLLLCGEWVLRRFAGLR